MHCGGLICVGDEIIRGPNNHGWQHDQGDGQGCPADPEVDLVGMLEMDPDIGDR